MSCDEIHPAALQVGGGSLAFEHDHWFSELEPPRLKLVLVLAGSITYQQDALAPERLRGPFLHLSLQQEPCSVSHGMTKGEQLQYVAARVPLSALRHSLGIDADRLMDHFRHLRQGESFQFNAAASPAQQAVARQILHCPWEGLARQFFLSGKGLELLAMALPPGASSAASFGAELGALEPRMLRQLRRAQALLLDALEQPPGLRELAREVGLNVNKLNQGFQRLHGRTVFEWLREQRMQRAQQLLASGRMDVGEAAALCGYSLSHFSKLFRQRFGVLPRELRLRQ